MKKTRLPTKAQVAFVSRAAADLLICEMAISKNSGGDHLRAIQDRSGIEEAVRRGILQWAEDHDRSTGHLSDVLALDIVETESFRRRNARGDV